MPSASRSGLETQSRLWPAHDFEPRDELGVEQLEARLVAGGGIVGANAFDEEQCVIGFRAADSDLRQRPGRAAGRNRDRRYEAQQVRYQRRAQTLDALCID